jgi:hypothetical protein
VENKALIGYTGSWAGHMARWHKINDLGEKLKRNPKKAKEILAEIRGVKDSEPKPTPIYVSKKKHKELLKLEELQYLGDLI